MKEKILRVIKKLFRIHSPSKEWMNIYRKDSPPSTK